MHKEEQEVRGMREFELNDIPTIVSINNRVNPKVPMTVGGRIALEEGRHPENPLKQWVVEREGKVVAYGDSGIVNGTSAEETFHIMVMTDPNYKGQGLATSILEKSFKFASDHGVTKLIGACSEDDSDSIKWILNRGFKLIGKNAEINLNLNLFEEDYHNSCIEEMKMHEINFRTAQQEKDEKPNFELELFETLASPIIKDMVLPGGATIEMGFDEFKAFIFGSEDANLENQVIALYNGQFIGWGSCLTGKREAAYINFLGVRKDFQNQGVERALVTHMCKTAKSSGFQKIGTHIQGIKENIISDMEATGWVVDTGRMIWSKTLT
ncbi:GNAT family N-acetyltransferase [Sporosarcina limicola]|uniref:Ribosomal protein S18 acetylase RimI-like enzyme n=1 Tax=Sporosarcina limicola TaxID=34101 RepID=A0A927MMQ7_9BACL|nr:GNAT family N-acetyltransferase [Sporosarcina limicola]MBE1556836.1 ribosomal protein S18 acetylase RimI-like enzyme [Sporosarcina limicola]